MQGRLPAGAGGGGALLRIFLHHAQVGVQAAVQERQHKGGSIKGAVQGAVQRKQGMRCGTKCWSQVSRHNCRLWPRSQQQQSHTGRGVQGLRFPLLPQAQPAPGACLAPPDAHGWVKGDLEGGALVLGADHGLELLGVNHPLHVCEKGGGGGDGLLRRLALQAGRGERAGGQAGRWSGGSCVQGVAGL